jgi:hypothetical protein
MKLRSFRPSDIGPISEIWDKHYSTESSLPNRRNSVVDAVVEDSNGKVIAYGQVKLFAEAMLFLDKDASLRDRTQALKLLMLEAFRGTQQAGIEQMYCFIQDPDFATLIERHFGFSIVDKGELLIREEV